MIDFPAILEKFARAAVAGDGAALAALFTEDGIYDDYFFGPHRGRAAIAQMLDRFQEGGEDFRWEFVDPLWDAASGYARYRFSYVSKVPESGGKVVAFEGIGRFRFAGEKIAHYSEVFDRGMALAQLDFDPVRIGRILNRYAEALRAVPEFEPHLSR